LKLHIHHQKKWDNEQIFIANISIAICRSREWPIKIAFSKHLPEQTTSAAFWNRARPGPTNIMGSAAGKPQDIQHFEARAYYEEFQRRSVAVPNPTSFSHRSLTRSIFESLQSTPATSPEFTLRITGSDTGPLFVAHYLFQLPDSDRLTKISFRKSSLTADHGRDLARFLAKHSNISQFDVGGNSLAAGAAPILVAALRHPSLISLQLDGCNLTEACVEPLVVLLRTSRKLRMLNADSIPIRGTRDMTLALQENHTLTCFVGGQSIAGVALKVTTRNSTVHAIFASIKESVVHSRTASKSIAHQKSMKGSFLVKGRAPGDSAPTETDMPGASREFEGPSRMLPVKHGAAATMGRRLRMEDVSIALPKSPRIGSVTFAVFDGHGGREAAEFASKNLPPAISSEIATGGVDAIERAFLNTQVQMVNWCTYVGTTAVVAILDGTVLTVANVGDSRCVLCRSGSPLRLSVDHTPQLPGEAKLITERGGSIVKGYVNGLLAVSRSLGDGFLGNCGNAHPHIESVSLKPGDAFLIIASDGLWDVMSDKEACEAIMGDVDLELAANTLVSQAYGRGSTDNISVIVVSLRDVVRGDQ
jgi:serine/threonine protein phosphatase PrpC